MYPSQYQARFSKLAYSCKNIPMLRVLIHIYSLNYCKLERHRSNRFFFNGNKPGNVLWNMEKYENRNGNLLDKQINMAVNSEDKFHQTCLFLTTCL